MISGKSVPVHFQGYMTLGKTVKGKTLPNRSWMIIKPVKMDSFGDHGVVTGTVSVNLG